MTHWWIAIVVVLIAAYAALLVWARKKQRAFEEQFNSAKKRYDVFVLQKRTDRERPQSGIMRFAKIKIYLVVGRANITQASRGFQISRMQTVTFQTTKEQYRKIELNRRYKMDVAGTYIGYVDAPSPQKKKGKRK